MSLLVKVVCSFLYVQFGTKTLSVRAFAVSHCNQLFVLRHVCFHSIATFSVVVFEEYSSLFALRYGVCPEGIGLARVHLLLS